MWLPITNERPPTLEQTDIFMRLATFGSSTPLFVHCAGGKGRAGTMVAQYLMAFGFSLPPDTWSIPSMEPKAAMAALRAMRNGSIENERQEAAVVAYSSALYKRRALFDELYPDPYPSGPIIAGDKRCLSSADLIVLVGLPGSGKSTLGRSLAARSTRRPVQHLQAGRGRRRRRQSRYDRW